MSKVSKVHLNERQKFLDELTSSKRKNINSDLRRCLNWNVRNPSLRRATRQMDWLEGNDFDVIALSEVKLSRGCVYIKDRLQSLGYKVMFPKPRNKDYGIILAIKKKFFKEVPRIHINFLPYRVSFAVCNLSGKEILFTGIYVPVWRNEKKRIFLETFEKLLANEGLRKEFDGSIILGDLNVLEPNHIPYHPMYKDWEYFYTAFSKYGFVDAFRFFHLGQREYSWFGREGDGYRFDHIFVSQNILPFLNNCYYIHEVRVEKLSDHSAMYLEIKSS